MPWGWSDRHIDEHERGHENVARALKCRTRRVAGRGGVPEVEIVSGPPLTPIEHAAIAYGGQVRAGRGGHEKDDRLAEQHLRRLPWSERGAARREAKRIARRYA